MTIRGWTHAYSAKQTRKAIRLLAQGESFESVAAATGYAVGHVRVNISRIGGKYEGLRARKQRSAIPAALVAEYHEIAPIVGSAQAARAVLKQYNQEIVT